MGTNVFETYNRKVGRRVMFSKDNIETYISCGLLTKEDVGSTLENAPRLRRKTNARGMR
jgi:hypothetical protein